MPILLLEGPRRWAEFSLQQVLPKVDETVHLSVEGLEKGLLRTELTAQGFFSSSRALILFDWSDTPAWTISEVEEALPLPADIWLVLRIPVGSRKKNPAGLAVDKTVSITTSSSVALVDEILRHFRLQESTRQVTAKLQEQMPDQYDEVFELAEKCATTGVTAIDPEALRAHAFFVEEGNVFALADAIIRGQISAALVEAERVAPMVAGDLQRLTGGLAWNVRQWIQQGRATPARLRYVYRDLRALDAMSKSGAVKDRELFLAFIRRCLRILHPLQGSY